MSKILSSPLYNRLQVRIRGGGEEQWPCTMAKGINTPSVKQSVKRRGPIGMHCDAPKWVPDPFPSSKWSGKCIPMGPCRLTLGVFTA